MKTENSQMNPDDLMKFFNSYQPHRGTMPLSGCIIIPDLQKCVKSLLNAKQTEIQQSLLQEIKTNLLKS